MPVRPATSVTYKGTWPPVAVATVACGDPDNPRMLDVPYDVRLVNPPIDRLWSWPGATKYNAEHDRSVR